MYEKIEISEGFTNISRVHVMSVEAHRLFHAALPYCCLAIDKDRFPRIFNTIKNIKSSFDHGNCPEELDRT